MLLMFYLTHGVITLSFCLFPLFRVYAKESSVSDAMFIMFDHLTLHMKRFQQFLHCI